MIVYRYNKEVENNIIKVDDKIYKDMRTTKAQVREYLIDCKGFDEQEVKEVIADYGNDLESYLRGCGADDDSIQEVKGFFN